MPNNRKNILVAIRGGNAGEEAFRLACGIAKGTKGKIYALYVIEVKQELPLDAEIDPSKGEEILRRIEALGKEEKCHMEGEYLQARQAGPAIVQEAINRVSELIVLGIPHQRNHGQFALGDTATYVMKNAQCPVILWREQASAAAATREG